MNLKQSTIPGIGLGQMTIPQVGLGLWQIKKEYDLRKAVLAALQAGYRHFDTAQVYGNEAFLGDVLRESDVPRSELFITTKLANDNQSWDAVVPSFTESLKNLQTDYVDLYLVHFPVTQSRRPAWRQMEAIARSGKAKAIGVSNYTVAHLDELLREADIRPVVNQVELHVYLQQPELVAYCQKHGIVIEAYSPLAHGYGIKHPTLQSIGAAYDKTPAQVMLRWCVQQGMVVLPKSVHPEYIQQNRDIFDFTLSEDDLGAIADLDKDLRTCWDPTHIP